jgi:hypothetical protein
VIPILVAEVEARLTQRRGEISTMRGSRSSMARASRLPGHSARTARRSRAPSSKVAALGGEHCEVAPGLVAVDPHVRAGELLGATQAQDLR